jgi:hypothetical protein
VVRDPKSEGYVLVSRRFFRREWLRDRKGQPFSRQEAWLDMIQLAAYSDGLDNLEIGEVEVSVRWAVRRWGWPIGKIHRQLQQWLDDGRLIQSRAWNTSRNTSRNTYGNTYLLANYECYQRPRNTERNTSRNTLRNKRERKHIENTSTKRNTPSPARRRKAARSVSYSDDFEAWWSAYPRKVGKVTAFESWESLNGTRPELAVLVSITDAHARQWDEESRPSDKIPHPSTWLNNRRWEDELTPHRAEPLPFPDVLAGTSQDPRANA